MYVGQTSLDTIEARLKEHIIDSNSSYKEKRPLYDAFHKYGIENFEISELEQVSYEKANERERYWIKQLRTYIGFSDCNGYNATLGGDSRQLYDYKEIADYFKQVQCIQTTANFFNCDIKTVRIACQ